jgi:hypothetical protein
MFDLKLKKAGIIIFFLVVSMSFKKDNDAFVRINHPDSTYFELSNNKTSIPIEPDICFSRFENDICLPSKLYMLSGVQNDIFIEPLIKRWRPLNDVVRFSGTIQFQRRLQRVASINKPLDATTVTVSLINLDKFDTIKTITSKIIVGIQGVGTDSVPVSIIGDSFTHGAFFKDAILAKNYVPYIQMIGLRDVKGYPGQFDEGRGGWTLAKYFSITKGRTQAYNGFWQPDDIYKYWGSTQFWKLANEIRLNPSGKWTFSESYNAGRYSTQSLLFDEKTGYKRSPEVNDIMYDNILGNYQKYDGSNWIQVAYDDYTWNFNYGKYLSMWKLKSPLILAEFLGLNDFRSAKDPAMIDFKKWNAQIETLVASYHEAVPSGKFVLMIPSSTCGILDNTAGDFTTIQNACMWEHRRNIIENFDRREAENIYVVDAGIAIDNVNGFRFTSDTTYTKPYSEFTGTEKIVIQTGNPHPYLNYPNMGVSLAAFIQKYR